MDLNFNTCFFPSLPSPPDQISGICYYQKQSLRKNDLNITTKFSPERINQIYTLNQDQNQSFHTERLISKIPHHPKLSHASNHTINSNTTFLSSKPSLLSSTKSFLNPIHTHKRQEIIKNKKSLSLLSIYSNVSKHDIRVKKNVSCDKSHQKCAVQSSECITIKKQTIFTQLYDPGLKKSVRDNKHQSKNLQKNSHIMNSKPEGYGTSKIKLYHQQPQQLIKFRPSSNLKVVCLKLLKTPSFEVRQCKKLLSSKTLFIMNDNDLLYSIMNKTRIHITQNVLPSTPRSLISFINKLVINSLNNALPITENKHCGKQISALSTLAAIKHLFPNNAITENNTNNKVSSLQYSFPSNHIKQFDSQLNSSNMNSNGMTEITWCLDSNFSITSSKFSMCEKNSNFSDNVLISDTTTCGRETFSDTESIKDLFPIIR